MKFDGYTKIKNLLITSSRLDNKEFRTLVYLLSISRKGFCYPSINTIADQLNMSRSSMYQIISSLESKGFILKENRTIGNGKKTSNRYLINEDAITKNIKKEVNSETAVMEEVTNDPQIDYSFSEFDWLNE